MVLSLNAFAFKSKLKVFCLGFGTGLAVAFLWIGLAPDRPREQSVDAAWVPETSTNLKMRLVWKAASASYPAPQKPNVANQAQ